MRSPKDIEYVDLTATDPVDDAPAFFFRRYRHESFRPPPSEMPHRHNYQELFIVLSGQGKHAIDGHDVELRSGTVSLISKGQVHIVEHLTDFTGCLIRFTDDFLPADMVAPDWNYRTALFNQLGPHHTFSVQPSDLAALDLVLGLIESEWRQELALHKDSVLRHLLAILIIRLERMYRNTIGTSPHQHEAYQRYQQFTSVLEEAFARHHDVQYYAAVLGLSPTRLSRSLNRVVGKATKQLIDERIVLEAKRLLHYTDLSIKEIGVALGYTDLFHFSKTFKRMTGLAPQAFREQRHKMT